MYQGAADMMGGMGGMGGGSAEPKVEEVDWMGH
jgi:hypothetical protein